MSSKEPKPNDDLRMSAAEFDRIMGQVLSVKPKAKKVKKVTAKKRRNAH